MDARRTTGSTPFDAQAFLDSAGAAREVAAYRRSAVVFAQGDDGDSIFYIQAGGVKLSAISPAGREAIVAMLGPGDFFGEGGLAGQSVRRTTATALTPTTALVIGKAEMMRVLRAEHALSEGFIAYMLSRNIRMEEDLLDQLFDSIEKGLARALLLRARYGTKDKPDRVLPTLSPAALAKMVGTTPERISEVLQKFTRLGFVEDGPAGLAISTSLLSVVLHD
jgi:CRP/FNR family transcriptional regulator, cyclic AMP receptor protein